MTIHTELWLERAIALLAQSADVNPNKPVQFATLMLTALYGSTSTQLETFLEDYAAIERRPREHSGPHLYQHAYGAITDTIAVLDGGLVTNLRVLFAGEVLSELVRLGETILQEQTEAAKNAAAVLIAAAFECLTRRMGGELVGVRGRTELQEVITALRDAGILQDGEVGAAQSFLEFRNNSLHAYCASVSRAQVESCVNYMEAMLLKHFS